MIEILALADLSGEKKEAALKAVREIFFISSGRQEFESSETKEGFYKRWCGDYQTTYPEEFFVATLEGKILGYLSGCSNSNLGLEVIKIGSYSLFKDQFDQFPAHLHINFHPDARGQGLGTILMNHYMKVLKQNHVRGIHLVTSPDAKNVSFYERLGFNHVVARDFKGSMLLFMGHILD